MARSKKLIKVLIEMASHGDSPSAQAQHLAEFAALTLEAEGVEVPADPPE